MTTIDLSWNTALLYPAPDSPELEADLSSFEQLANDFRATYFEKLASLDAPAILQAIQEYEAMQTRMAKPFCYAHLLFAADSANELHRALSQRCSELGSRLSQTLLFFDLELMHLPDEHFSQLCTLPGAAVYVHFLEGIRKFKPYTLQENEERLLTRKDLTGSRAFTKLFDELSASLKYQMEFEGELKQFTGEELLSLLHHPSPEVRFNAQTCFLEKHAESGNALVFGTVFNTMALDHGQEMELRGYGSPIQPTN
ncbi:MAG: oligoendopeptidase F, partial [Trichlorobacter sp.]